MKLKITRTFVSLSHDGSPHLLDFSVSLSWRPIGTRLNAAWAWSIAGKGHASGRVSENWSCGFYSLRRIAGERALTMTRADLAA